MNKAIESSRRITVVGSVNLDVVARVTALPRAGETVTNATLQRYPGGKGANQALAARRLGADVCLVACVGADASADDALALLRADGVDLSRLVVDRDAPTGTALIAVDDAAENQIVVAPGANRRLLPEVIDLPQADAVICQLEVPLPSLVHLARIVRGFFCINLAPVFAVPDVLIERADLLVVNEIEAEFYGDKLQQAPGYVAKTYGRRGAVLLQRGRVLAEAAPPAVDAIDTTGAGDTFTAALTLALIEKQAPVDALRFACAAAATSTCANGAQPSLPYRDAVEALLRA